MSRWRFGAGTGAALLTAVATLLIFGVLEWLRPYYFLWDDNASFYLPAYAHNWRTLSEHGVLAEVNLHQYLGQMWVGNGQSGVLYPPVYLAAAAAEALWGDLRPAVDLLAVGHLTLAALGMLALLRAFNVGRAIAVLASLLWVTFPFLAQVTRNWVVVSYAAALLPWNLLLLERLRRRPSAGRALALAAVKALLFFQGYVQYAVLIALGDGLYLLFAALRHGAEPRTARRDAAKVALAYGAALLMTGVLAAPLLLPMWQVKQLSAYRAGALSYAEFVSNAMPLQAFGLAQLGVMVPKAIHGASGAIFFAAPALLLVLLLAAPAVRRAAPKFALPAAAAGLGALVLASEAWGALYRVPLLNSFRWPFKSYLIFLAFTAIAAAGAAAALAARGPAGQRWAVGLLAAGVAANLTVLFAPAWDRTFGPYRIDREVGALSRQVTSTLPASGRVISLWQRHDQPSMPRHLTLSFATLLGAHHLGGYDPLIARDNLRLALGLEYSNIFRYALDERVLGHLERWGVRALVVPADARYRLALEAWPQLSRRYADGELEVWENAAALPLVSFVDAPATPVPFAEVGNGLDIDVAGRAGTLRVALAPLPWWFLEIDGVDAGAAAFDEREQMRIAVPAGTSRVAVRYVDVPLRFGATLAAAFSALAGVFALARRRRRGRG